MADALAPPALAPDSGRLRTPLTIILGAIGLFALCLSYTWHMPLPWVSEQHPSHFALQTQVPALRLRACVTLSHLAFTAWYPRV